MFAKGQRVITPFGVGEIKSVADSSCVVELFGSKNSTRRIGTFTKNKLQVCSIVEVPIQKEEPIPIAPVQSNALENLDQPNPDVIAIEPETLPTKPRKKRGQTQP